MILIKTPEEIEKVRAACKIAALTLLNLEKHIKEGVTTEELDRLGEEMIVKCGGQAAFKGYRGYKHATCISVNEEVVHGIPGKRKIKEGDIVGMDVGVLLSGFYGDVARTYPVGRISKKVEQLLKCGWEALQAGIKNARTGNHLGDISHAIEERARKEGFSVVRDLFGHGVGRNLHEDPLIPNFGRPGEGPELYAGMILAIEPMINLGGSRIVTLSDGWTVVTEDRSLSVHFENTILITKGEPEVLTSDS